MNVYYVPHSGGQPMTLNTMQIWRWITPAVLIIVYSAVIWFIVLGTFPSLPDFSKAPYLVSVVVPAALYYITPLRAWVNRSAHERITENLRAGMVSISGYDDKPEKYTWLSLRSLFFKLIDDDKSLSPGSFGEALFQHPLKGARYPNGHTTLTRLDRFLRT